MSICQFPISNSKGICYRQRTTECVKENNGITKFFLKDLIKESTLKNNDDVSKNEIQDKEKKNVHPNEKNQSFNVSYTWETDIISGLRFINVLNKKDKKKLGFQCIYCRDRQLFKKKSSVLFHMVTFNHGLKNSVIDELKINERTSDDRLNFINNFNAEKQITIEKENIVEKNITKDYNLIKLEIEFVSTMNLLTLDELKELFLFFFPEQVMSTDENIIKENVIEKFLLNINSLSENYSRIIEKEYHMPHCSKDLNHITLSEYLNQLKNVKLEEKTNLHCEEIVDSELAINETMTSQNKQCEEKKMCANQEKNIVETSNENILSKNITEEQKVYIIEENRNDKINAEDQVHIKSVEKKDNVVVDEKNMNNLVIEQNIENVIVEEKKKRKRKEKIKIDENKHILININDYNILRHDDQLFISLTTNKNKPRKEKTIIGKENLLIINNSINNDEMNKQDNNDENMNTTTCSNINDNNSTKSNNNNNNNFHNIYNCGSSYNNHEHIKNVKGSDNSNIHPNSNNNNNNNNNDNKNKNTMNVLLNLNDKEKKKRSRNEGNKEAKMNVTKKVRNMENKNNMDTNFLYEKNVDNQNKNEHLSEQKLINYESIIGIDDITKSNGLKEQDNTISSNPNYNIISTASNTCDMQEEFYNNMNININRCLCKQTIINNNNDDINNNNNIINVNETKEQGNVKDSYSTNNNEEDTNILNKIPNDNKIQRIQIQVDDDLNDNKKNISEKNVEEPILNCSKNKIVNMVNYKDKIRIDKRRNKSVIEKKEINNKNILKKITKTNTLNSNTKGRKQKANIIETQKDNILKKNLKRNYSYKINTYKEKKRIINYNKRNNSRKNIIKTTGLMNNYYKHQHIDNIIINKKKNTKLFNKKNKLNNIINNKCYKKVNEHICTSSIKEIKQLCNLSNENIIPHNEHLSCTRSYRLSRYIKK
ncbi:hypothetical protein PGSY75_1231000 [Plasmodium gaboni]|uniref:Uncharacterized protein n=1 Tax=Plasmodium gaboni TaxID=647221 RepID=A0A151LGX5_9APIC|nr:hypothetical protein PGSY75_1231000 [Plasmodium gaboni]KYN98109.1 hypothetical protein PGSY75_1231000 [Plasmodium gaboni]